MHLRLKRIQCSIPSWYQPPPPPSQQGRRRERWAGRDGGSGESEWEKSKESKKYISDWIVVITIWGTKTTLWEGAALPDFVWIQPHPVRCVGAASLLLLLLCECVCVCVFRTQTHRRAALSWEDESCLRVLHAAQSSCTKVHDVTWGEKLGREGKISFWCLQTYTLIRMCLDLNAWGKPEGGRKTLKAEENSHLSMMYFWC